MRFIYVARNLINGKVYVGQTSDVERRKKDHIDCARKGSDCRFHLAIRKYGIENFLFEVVEMCEDILSNEREQFWIERFDSFHNGYNLTTGGQPGDYRFKFSESTRQKMSEAQRKRPPITEETRRKMSESRTGKKKRPHSEETRKKISESKKGTSPPNKGKKASEETLEKMRISRSGVKIKPHSEETKQKLRKPKICKNCNKPGHMSKTCKETI